MKEHTNLLMKKHFVELSIKPDLLFVFSMQFIFLDPRIKAESTLQLHLG